MDRRLAALAGALLALALVLRVGVVLANPDLPLQNDPADYAHHARSIASGDGYPPSGFEGVDGPSALRPPGYPYLLGGIFALTDDSVDAARIAQALLGVVAVALVGLLARRLWGDVVGLVTLAVAAVYPPLIVTAANLGAEPLFLVVMLGAVAAALELRRTRRPHWALAAGALAGVAILTRSNGALLLVPLAIAAWGRPVRSWRGAAAPALLVAAAAVAIAPWTIRNAVVMDTFVPVAAQDGFTLAGTYNDTSRADRTFPAAWRPPTLDPELRELMRRHAGEGELALNAELRAAAREYAADHPGYVVRVLWENTLRLFMLGGQDFNRLATASELGLGSRWADAVALGFVPFALLALGGCLTRRAREAPPWVWLVPVLMLAGVVLMNASPRFRLPADPFIALLAAVALTQAVTVAGRRRSAVRRGAA